MSRRADTSVVFKRHRNKIVDETVDVAARLHPYEHLFNEAMAMAARFAEERERRERAASAPPAGRLLRRRAS